MRFLGLSCSTIATLAAFPALAQGYPPPTQLPPPPGYAAPAYPPPGYGAPPPGYVAAPPSYGAPPPGYAPPATYGGQVPAYAPPPAYPPPPATYGGQGPDYPPANYGTTAMPPAPGYGAGPAEAAAPLGANPATGARPGHQPGQGVSYPLSGGASNIDSRDTRSVIAPTLPTPALGPGAGPVQYLQAARASLAAGRSGEAQQSLEMAQTRLLDRSVAYDNTNAPSANPAVSQISEALRALAAGDRQRTMQIIDATIPQAAAEAGPGR